MHGNEPSGTEATLRTMYELAGRSDCAATQVLDNSVSLLIPTQNPDGRTAGTRRNAYWFDLNRDDWARTQPETDSRIELFRKYPPLLFADEHENGTSQYFFPPNTDPVYHEVPDTSVDWIDNLYGAAMAQAFQSLGYRYYTGQQSGYDYFAPEYGDTVVSDGFLGAGMTFEKGSNDLYRREGAPAVGDPVGVARPGRDARRRSWCPAGTTPTSRPTRRARTGCSSRTCSRTRPTPLYQQVPDRLVRSYFLRDEPGSHRALMILVRRLQRMDVAVYRLTAPVTVSDFKPYGRPEAVDDAAGRDDLGADGAGPEALGPDDAERGHLHRQAVLLRHDGLEPAAAARRGGRLVRPPAGAAGAAHPGRRLGARAAAAAERPAADRRVPDVDRRQRRDLGRLAALDVRPRLEHPVPGAVRRRHRRTARSNSIDVLLVPDGHAKAGMGFLGPDGQQALKTWVANGGRYIGWVEGVHLATHAGHRHRQAGMAVGEHPRLDLPRQGRPDSPLSTGIGDTDYVFNTTDYRSSSRPSRGTWSSPIPKKESDDWFRSGFSAARPGVLARPRW